MEQSLRDEMVAEQSPYVKLDEPTMPSPTQPLLAAKNIGKGEDSEVVIGLDHLHPAQDAAERQSAFAQDVNQLRPEESSMQCQSIVATMFLMGGVAAGVVLFVNGTVPMEGLIGILAGSYILYLIVGCCCNKLSSYLSNIDHGAHFEQYYQQLRNGKGHFNFHAQCYHYETHWHTRTYTDSDGNIQTQTYTTTEKVVTHTANEPLHPRHTKDESGPADRIRANTSMVFLHFFLHYRLADDHSRVCFDAFYADFKRRHTRDTHQDFSFKYLLPGMIERKAFFVGKLDCDYSSWFCLCGALCCLCPFSCWVESKISRFSINMTKALTL